MLFPDAAAVSDRELVVKFVGFLLDVGCGGVRNEEVLYVWTATAGNVGASRRGAEDIGREYDDHEEIGRMLAVSDSTRRHSRPNDVD